MIANIPIIRSNQIKYPRTVGLPLARDFLYNMAVANYLNIKR